VESFIPHLPKLEHLIEKCFHGLFSDKETSEGTPGEFVVEISITSSLSSGQNFPDWITCITSKDD